MKKEWNEGFPLPRGLSKKMLLRMKLTLVLLCCMFMQSFASLYAQSITLKKRNASLEEVIWELKEKTKLTFLYSDEDVSAVKGIDLDVKDLGVDAVLEQCLAGTGLGYVKTNDAIIIRKVEELEQSSQQKMRRITGKVTDENGEPLPGVGILIQGTTMGVASDVEGNYALDCPDMENLTLLFSFVGMESQQIVVGTRSVVNVVMKSEAAEIEEVVVTGYFTRKKDSYTGSATTFSGEKLMQISTGNVLSSLSVIDPSFKLVENISAGSNPNYIPEFQIHGAGNLESTYENSPNMPTFILDGFEVDAEKIFDMDPNRIESITILKDAAATVIYGSRAANGVVVVETKAPEMGELRVSYSFSGDFNFADLSDYNLMNAAEKLEYERLAGLYSHYNVGQMEVLSEEYNERLKLVASGVNTDWIKKPIHAVGFGHKHSLLLEGGDTRLRYGMDLNYQKVTGVMKESGRQNIGIGIKLQYRYNNLRFMNNLTYNNVKQEDSPYGTFSDYTYMNPYLYPYDENGNVRQVLEIGGNNDDEAGDEIEDEEEDEEENREVDYELNPLYNAKLGTKLEAVYQDFTDNFSVEWDVIEGLKLKGAISLNKKTTIRDEFLPSGHNSFYEKDLKGSYTKEVTDYFSYDANVMASYVKNLAKHLLNATVVWNVTQSKTDEFTTVAYNFPNDNMDHIGMGVEYQEGDKPDGNYEISRLMGVVGNFNYSYDNRYLADFSVRSDGSSVYGSSKRWGTFGSIGLAWNMHNERWLADNNSVNELKLRGSWGTTGGQNFYPFQAMMMYSYKDDAINGLSYDDYLGALLMAYGNPDLKWQRTEKLNVGIDFTLFNSRLTGYFNWYKDVSKSVLIDVLLAPSLGFDSYKDNLGEIENKGVELNLRGTLIKNVRKELQWDVFFNLTHNKNRLLKLNDALAAYNKMQDDEMNNEDNEETRAPMVRYQEGESINTIWANESIGIDPNTGEEVFIAQNGDKVNEWSTDNYKPLGCEDPKIEGNFGTMLMYKGFQLNAYFYYSFGGDIYNQTLVDKVENVDPQRNADKRVLYDRWRQPGDVAKYKAIDNTTTTMPTSRFIEQENYIRLSSLNLSYQFTPEQLKRMGIERLKVSLIGNDIFRASTVKMERGTSYPFARNYSLSLQVTF